MRLVVYDRNPGPGLMNFLLRITWALGARLQKLFGKCDAYFGARSWDEAFTWVENTLTHRGQPGKYLTSFQYWGHGGPGSIYLAKRTLRWKDCIDRLWPFVLHKTIIWWRVCSAFKGEIGHTFAKTLGDGLCCTIAGHTRRIGIVQGGLHTRHFMEDPRWPITEGEPAKSWLPGYLRWGPNSIWFWETKIPKDW